MKIKKCGHLLEGENEISGLGWILRGPWGWGMNRGGGGGGGGPKGALGWGIARGWLDQYAVKGLLF